MGLASNKHPHHLQALHVNQLDLFLPHHPSNRPVPHAAHSLLPRLDLSNNHLSVELPPAVVEAVAASTRLCDTFAGAAHSVQDAKMHTLFFTGPGYEVGSSWGVQAGR